jgi:hypothetical protein
MAFISINVKQRGDIIVIFQVILPIIKLIPNLNDLFKG